MAAGSLRLRRFPAQWLTARPATRQWLGCRRSDFACSRSGSSMGRLHQRFSKFSPLQRHEPVGFREGASSVGGAPADWLEHQTRDSRFTPHSVAARLARHSVRVPRFGGDWPTHVSAHRQEDRSYSTRSVRPRKASNQSTEPTASGAYDCVMAGRCVLRFGRRTLARGRLSCSR